MSLENVLIIALPLLELVWAIGATIYIVLQRRSAQATLAWALAFVLLPLLGIALYFFFGPRRFDKRKRRRARAKGAVQRKTDVDERSNFEVSPRVRHLMALCESSVGLAARPRRAHVELLLGGREMYAALFEAIDAAESHVHLEYYIWEPDRIGSALRDRLCAKARAGVEIRVLVDGLGSARAQRRFWAPLREAGGLVEHFNEPSRWRPRMANFRTHRKIVVVDGLVGFTGGMNVTDHHTSEHSGEDAWRDSHLKLRGPAVKGLSMVFFEDWSYATGDTPELGRYFAQPESTDGPLMQIVSSGPDENLDAIHKLFFASIAGASHRVWLTTPYFVPDEAVFHALTTAALAGTDVRILVPERGDQPIVSAAARSYYPELLESGVRVFEYRHPVLHAKTLLIDDEVGVVGTANTDNRSFRLNFEVVAVAYDKRLCESLAAAFEHDLTRAEEVTLERVHAATFGQRLFTAGARLFSPIL